MIPRRGTRRRHPVDLEGRRYMLAAGATAQWQYRSPATRQAALQLGMVGVGGMSRLQTAWRAGEALLAAEWPRSSNKPARWGP